MNIDFHKSLVEKIRFNLRVLAIRGVVFFVVLSYAAKISILTCRSQKVQIFIKSWYGQLGNNLVQLTHTIYLAKKLNVNIHLPVHGFLKVNSIFSCHSITPYSFLEANHDFLPRNRFLGVWANNLIDNLGNPEEFKSPSSLSRDFYYYFDIFPILPSLSDYRKILKDEILPVIPFEEDETIGDTTLVIHMRSGDVFDEDKPVHRTYVQPPLSFYVEVIERHGFEDIVVVTQPDFKNPCVNGLKKIFPNIRIQSSSLFKDVSTILSAQNLVVGIGTFAITLAFSSPKIRNVYVPVIDIKSDAPIRKSFLPKLLRLSEAHRENSDLNFKIHLMKIRNYILLGDWQNTSKQRSLMIDHPRKYVVPLEEST